MPSLCVHLAAEPPAAANETLQPVVDKLFATSSCCDESLDNLAVVLLAVLVVVAAENAVVGFVSTVLAASANRISSEPPAVLNSGYCEYVSILVPGAAAVSAAKRIQ